MEIAALKGTDPEPAASLVTLLGPGRTGKTRLSLQVAQEVLDYFPQGAFFVPLADDMDANQFVLDALPSSSKCVKAGGLCWKI